MKRYSTAIAVLLLPLLLLTGCSSVESKTASLSIIYGVSAAVSLLLLIGYCFLVRKKDIWFLLLFSCVFVVNVGYLCLSSSGTLEEALLANRISYLGSVFLPFSMLMIILEVCNLRPNKWISTALLCLCGIVFFIAASPGYLDIYYKSVQLEVNNGVAILVKEYGSWHGCYLFYLAGYFSTMLAVIIFASIKKTVSSSMHAVMLLVAVFVNIGVWLLEQFVQIDFEFLSISYIISELFLLGLCLMLQEFESKNKAESTSAFSPQETTAVNAVSPVNRPSSSSPASSLSERCAYFAGQIDGLTPTERRIFRMYLSGKSTKEVLSSMNITENTLKYHNKNIYGKLGVSSRKQLLEIAEILQLRE